MIKIVQLSAGLKQVAHIMKTQDCEINYCDKVVEISFFAEKKSSRQISFMFLQKKISTREKKLSYKLK